MTENAEQKALRLQLEAECRRIAERLRVMLRPGIGFALLLFDFGPHGAMAYASTARREDMVKAMTEFLATVGDAPRPAKVGRT